MKDLLITLTGPDRTGVVGRMAGLLSECEGNWLDSRLMRLEGSFSGILRVSLPPHMVEAFSLKVASLMEELGYQHMVQFTSSSGAVAMGRRVHLSLSGQDHPGIIEGVFRTLGEAGVNVEELSSGLQAAPWSGTPVFEASASLKVPEDIRLETLQVTLEGLANDLLVELSLSES